MPARKAARLGDLEPARSGDTQATRSTGGDWRAAAMAMVIGKTARTRQIILRFIESPRTRDAQETLDQCLEREYAAPGICRGRMRLTDDITVLGADQIRDPLQAREVLRRNACRELDLHRDGLRSRIKHEIDLVAIAGTQETRVRIDASCREGAQYLLDDKTLPARPCHRMPQQFRARADTRQRVQKSGIAQVDLGASGQSLA